MESASGPFPIDPDIRRAETLPGSFYRSPAAFEAVREQVFARSWQWVGFDGQLESTDFARPITLLPDLLDEPLVLTRDAQGTVRCLSNVCTHRANLVAREAGSCRALACKYHGRRFDLAGRFLSMPEFEGVEDFPGEADHLPTLPSGTLGQHRFASLDPVCDFDAWIAPVRERVGSLPLEEFRYDPERSRDYVIDAHWALYVDNYLEGLHIPFVHPGLARSVEFATYEVQTHPWSSLQLAYPQDGELAFDGPLSEHDGERPRAAYYFWLFPNTMLNFYPWGLSINLVQPLAIDRTRIVYHTFVWKPELLGQGAGGALDAVELEDDEVVEYAQKGVRSRLYRSGRYSAKREQAVHHFHRLLGRTLGAR